MKIMKSFILLFLIVILAGSLSAALDLKKVPELTGIKGGTVVILNCGDDKTITDLYENSFNSKYKMTSKYHIQGLDTDNKKIESVRKHIKSAGLYGKITARKYDGKNLPYIQNSINLIISENPGKVSSKEIMRVLSPRGVAYIQKNGKWTKTTKPVPKDIDDWRQALYDSKNGLVSKDMQVGPPRHVQWFTWPKFTRSHEHMSSFSVIVSDKGKVFYVADEGSRLAAMLPAKWVLKARDGFSGKLLWSRKLESWHPHLWPLKSGPSQLQRRLIVADGKLYLPLTGAGELSQLDAETGEVLHTYKGTKNVEEVVTIDNKLYLQLSDTVAKMQKFNYSNKHVWGAAGDAKRDYKWEPNTRQIMCIDIKTGKQLWKYDTIYVPMTLTVDEKRVYFFDFSSIISLDAKTGKRKWKSKPIVHEKYKPGELGTAFNPTLMVYKDTLLFSGQEHKYKDKDNVIEALDANTGRILWEQKRYETGHHSPEDIFVIDDLVWNGDIARISKSEEYAPMIGANLKTGKIERKFLCDVFPDSWFHHRCFRAKATEKYVISALTGTEYIDVRTKHWEINHWVRGSCAFGVMPANGMTYVPPNPCACFSESQLRGLYAFASARKDVIPDVKERLIKGPAFDKKITSNSKKDDWPMFRKSVSRGSATTSSVSTKLKKSWKINIKAEKLTTPVVAEGKLFIADIHKHTLYALDDSSGKIKWKFTANGRIDSPPAIYKGHVIFGGADGWVYNLNAADGELIWKYLAARKDLQHMANDQMESVWPLHGSVLIVKNKLYCTAGRSIFVDGGRDMVILDPITGKLITRKNSNDMDPVTKKSLNIRSGGKKTPPARTDILSFNGKNIFLGSQKFNLDGNREWPTQKGEDIPGTKTLTGSKSDQYGQDVHMFPLSGFLDDSYFHRTFWIYGKASGGGWGGWHVPMRIIPTGRILVLKDDTIFGYGRKSAYFAQSSATEYKLYAAKATYRNPKDIEREKALKNKEKKPKPDKPKFPPEIQMQIDKLIDKRNSLEKGSTDHGKAQKAYKDFLSKYKKAQKDKQKKLENEGKAPKTKKAKPIVNAADASENLNLNDAQITKVGYQWKMDDPGIMVRALILANDTLLAAGPPDVVDESKMYGMFQDEKALVKLKSQQNAIEGKMGAKLMSVSAKSGKKLGEYKLDSPPVFDGMISANGKVYIVLMNGDIVCLK